MNIQIRSGKLPTGPLLLPAAPAEGPIVPLVLNAPTLAPAPSLAPALSMAAATPYHTLDSGMSNMAPAASQTLQAAAQWPAVASAPTLAPISAQHLAPAQQLAETFQSPSEAPLAAQSTKLGAVAADVAPALAPSLNHQYSSETQSSLQHHSHGPAPGPDMAKASTRAGAAAAVAADMAPALAPSPSHWPDSTMQGSSQHHRSAIAPGPGNAEGLTQTGGAAAAAGIALARAPSTSHQPSIDAQQIFQQHIHVPAPGPDMSSGLFPVEAHVLAAASGESSAGALVCPPCTCPSAWAPAPGPSASAALGYSKHNEIAMAPRTMATAPQPHAGVFPPLHAAHSYTLRPHASVHSFSQLRVTLHLTHDLQILQW